MNDNSVVHPPGFLSYPTRFLFFTGKGGVGKTSIACAASLALADGGKSVLLVSTDPASNLDEILDVPLGNLPVVVPGAARLHVLNIDPTSAAESYRIRVLAQMGPDASDQDRDTVREQLSGACTTEIAAFDEFVGRLAVDDGGYDHIVFDTAPTGHTLRLLSLPKAWSGFLEGNDHGASCLGPHSGLKMQESRFRTAMATLSDPASTTIILVTRPEIGAIAEAARTSAELRALGLSNQRLVVNGMFGASDRSDATAASLEDQGKRALADLPAALRELPRDDIPLGPFDMLGLRALRSLLGPDPATVVIVGSSAAAPFASDLPALDRLIDLLAVEGTGLIMVMGKGGVGKTTIAASIALGLVQRGHTAHLSTTDPAAHLAMTLEGEVPRLRVDRIDPKAETERYVDKIMKDRGRNLDAQGQALLREDLRSPCTEEVAVFHAFSRIVAEARGAFVVLDTAPTGHTLLLMDATGAYHRQMTRQTNSTAIAGRIITPLMRLQDPAYTRILLVTLAETTPVSQASALQDDLRRAHIEPYAWVVNKSLLAAGTRDPLLRQRLLGERKQIDRVCGSMAKRVFFVPWQANPPIGLPALQELARPRPLAPPNH
ncbi:arsenical pump-driving ATPase (plasmid) [Methylocapsa polymorpha]|uniref:Arsenical pump-driving ATPase n=1 Tax=Methylocapsa polymorpha TaxID=3080828 RepID=A0ABZ0HZ81_9HYPH|nr:arsenical pump-driving ATPase [Methylocapsa sp. RX1]WOJ91729.1 arsenical pump-driving ATPase [Methylocapsa sp. RX1]